MRDNDVRRAWRAGASRARSSWPRWVWLRLALLVGLGAMLTGTPTTHAQRVRPHIAASCSGTPIASAAALQAINTSATTLSGTYCLTTNLDLSGVTFTPIGSYSSPFAGSFDGQGHTISNLTINLPNASNVGLFGYTSGATIQNISVVNVSIAGSTSVGGLVGINNGTISQAYSTGSVSGSLYVGGLVGINEDTITQAYSTSSASGGSSVAGGLVGINDGTIMHSYSTGSVSGTYYVGGLVGYIDSSSITQAYSSGSVTGGPGSKNVGGLVGYIDSSSSISQAYSSDSVSGTYNVGGLVGYSSGSISQAYSTGSATGTDTVGGLAGFNVGTINQAYSTDSVSGSKNVGGLVGYSSGSINQAYSIGSVSGTYIVGGLVGCNVGNIDQTYGTGSVSGPYGGGGLVATNCYSRTSSVTSSFWDTDTSGQTSSDGGTGEPDSAMKAQATFTGATPSWNFTPGAGVWGIHEGSSYPYLQALSSITTPPTVTPTGSVTPAATITSTATPISTSTATATPSPTGGSPTLLGPAPGWSKLRSDLHNDGASTISLNLANAPGPLYSTKLVPGAYPRPLTANPAVGPDGTAYEPDGFGHLVALNPDNTGSIRWTSAAVLGPSPNGLVANALPSSPAVRADGTVFVGSATGGIYSFTSTGPNSVQTQQFYPNGTFLSSSVIIGPDGTVYGGSYDGAVYAVKPDGTTLWPPLKLNSGDCPSGYTLHIGSTPALDKNGTLYLGYACVSRTQIPRGGTVAISNSGSEVWHTSATLASGVPQGASWGAIILSPDESTVYVTDFTQDSIYALSTSSGSQKWLFSPAGTAIKAAPALSPHGDVLYVATGGDATGDIFYAVDAASGNVIKVAGTADGVMAYGAGSASPAVDGAGNVLFGDNGGYLYGFAPRLDHQLFPPEQVNNVTSVLEGGPIIANLNPTTTVIYVTNSKGYLTALEEGIQAPTPVPTSTPLPASQGTPILQPTLTPVPALPTYTATITSTPGPCMPITSATDLQNINNSLAGNYCLTTNLDLTGVAFTPIGNGSTPFTGSFDGQGHTISNLTINPPNASDVGLFGYISGATIKNIGLVHAAIAGHNFVGGLVGYSYNGSISQAYSSGSVTGGSGSSNVGGLVGTNGGGIRRAYSTSSVTGGANANNVGGLVGYNVGSITQAYSTGSVTGGTGSQGVGGFVGYSYFGSISQAYSIGNVAAGSGSQGVAGLVGQNFGSVSQTYSTGSVSGGSGSSYVGGLVGNNVSTVTSSFWDTTTSGQTTSAGGTGEPDSAVRARATFTGATPPWDFTPGTGAWGIVEGSSYPYLQALGSTVLPQTTATPTSTTTPTASATATLTPTGTSTAPNTSTATQTSTTTTTPVPPTATTVGSGIPSGTEPPLAMLSATATTTVPPTATTTSTLTPTATATATATPTDTAALAPPFTFPGSTVRATATSTNTPAAPTSTATPAAACMLAVLPLLPVAHRGGEQVLMYATAPNTVVGTSLRFDANYPASAVLFIDQAANSVPSAKRLLSGKRFTNGYHYTFTIGSSGIALLYVSIPTNAPVQRNVVVTARSTCSATTIAGFAVAARGKGATSDRLGATVPGGTQIEFRLPARFTLPKGVRLAGTMHIRKVTGPTGAVKQFLDYVVRLPT